MKNLFEAETVHEVKERMARMTPDNAREWGKMNAAQAIADCSGEWSWRSEVGETLHQEREKLETAWLEADRGELSSVSEVRREMQEMKVEWMTGRLRA